MAAIRTVGAASDGYGGLSRDVESRCRPSRLLLVDVEPLDRSDVARGPRAARELHPSARRPRRAGHPRRRPRPCRRGSCAPSRRRRAGRPRGAPSRGRTRPARARARARDACRDPGHGGYRRPDGHRRGARHRHHHARGRRDRQRGQHELLHGGGVAGAIARAGGPDRPRESREGADRARRGGRDRRPATCPPAGSSTPPRWSSAARRRPTSSAAPPRPRSRGPTSSAPAGSRSSPSAPGSAASRSTRRPRSRSRRSAATSTPARGLERVVFAVHGDAAREAFEAAVGLTACERARARSAAAAAPPSATARLRDVLAGGAAARPAELDKPRSGYGEPVEVAFAAGDDQPARRHAGRGRPARRPRRGRPSAHGCSSPPPSPRSSTSPAPAPPARRRRPRARGRRPRRLPAARAPRPRRARGPRRARAARLRRARRRHRPAAGPRGRAPGRLLEPARAAGRRSAPAIRCGSPRRSRGSAGGPRTRARWRSSRTRCSRCCSPRERAVAPARGPRPGPARRAADPPAARRHGQVGRLPHGLRAPAARLRGQRARARAGGRRGAAGGRAAGREAVGRPAPRVPQPAPRRRDPAADRGGRRCHRVCACRPRETMRPMPDLGRVTTQVTTKLFTARTLAEAGVLHPGRPDHVRRRRARAPALRADAGGRLQRVRRALRDRDRDHRRARDADIPARSTSARTRSPTRWPPTASRRATASGSCAATIAASSTP